MFVPPAGVFDCGIIWLFQLLAMLGTLTNFFLMMPDQGFDFIPLICLQDFSAPSLSAKQQGYLPCSVMPVKQTPTSSSSSKSLSLTIGMMFEMRAPKDHNSTMSTKLMSSRDLGIVLGVWPAPASR